MNHELWAFALPGFLAQIVDGMLRVAFDIIESSSLLAIGVHAPRATAATNALQHEADIAKVQEWLGHANIATTRLYDRCKSRPEDSPCPCA